MNRKQKAAIIKSLLDMHGLFHEIIGSRTTTEESAPDPMGDVGEHIERIMDNIAAGVYPAHFFDFIAELKARKNATFDYEDRRPCLFDSEYRQDTAKMLAEKIITLATEGCDE